MFAYEAPKQILQNDVPAPGLRPHAEPSAHPGPGTGFLWGTPRDCGLQSHAHGWRPDSRAHFQVPLWHKGKSVFTIHGFESVRIVGTADLRD